MNVKFEELHTISTQKFLEGELVSEIKHEYIDGAVYAMAGAGTNHNRITTNLVSALRVQLRNTRCEPFASDMKVNVQSDYFYPDVMVVCEHQANDHGVTDSPVIIVEVLSKATRKTDHTIKRRAYQSLPSLKEYLLIEQDIVDVEVCRKNNHWQSEHFYLGDDVYFEACDLRLPVAEIYDRVSNQDMAEFIAQQTADADFAAPEEH